LCSTHVRRKFANATNAPLLMPLSPVLFHMHLHNIFLSYQYQCDATSSLCFQFSLPSHQTTLQCRHRRNHFHAIFNVLQNEVNIAHTLTIVSPLACFASSAIVVALMPLSSYCHSNLEPMKCYFD
jgi:hypothetical protein